MADFAERKVSKRAWTSPSVLALVSVGEARSDDFSATPHCVDKDGFLKCILKIDDTRGTL